MNNTELREKITCPRKSRIKAKK